MPLFKLPLGRKSNGAEFEIFLRRFWIAGVGTLIMACTLVLRLVYLQVFHHDLYTTLSQENRLKVVPLPPIRGLIYSRDGVLVAGNRPSFALEVVPERVADLEQSIAGIRQLMTLESDQIERFHTDLKQKRRFDTITLKSNLTTEEVAIFAVNRHRFAGFEIAGRLTRYYPLGSQMVHAVGYVGRINLEELNRIDAGSYSGTTHIGKEGIEKGQEEVLHGTVGYQRVEVNAQGRILRVVERTPPIPGKDVHLTLDSTLQAAAIEALAGNKGAIVAIEPATGAVLAFVSNPAFDPNEFVNGISAKLYAALRDSPDRPLFNRVLQGLYPPGSTIKPAMAIAGLEYKIRLPSDRTWCPGWIRLPGQIHKYRCWQKAGHGSVDLSRAIAESCDVYFYTLAKDLGIDRMHDMLANFSLGQRTGVDLPGELTGILPSREWKRRTRKLPWFPGETLINGIGQGFMLATPMQLAKMATVFANRGEVVAPHLTDYFSDPLTNVHSEPERIARTRAASIDSSTWQIAIDGMHEVVQGARGTAQATGVGASYQYAGKTGTAQLFGIAQDKTVKNENVVKHLRDHALFIAFAPLDHPRIALGIVIENGESGSHAAAPIARQLFDLYLDSMPPAPNANG